MIRLLCFFIVMVCCAKAQADEPSGNDPQEASRDRQADEQNADLPVPQEIARASYAEGETLYQAGDYAAAEAAFIRAYEAVASPLVLIAIAESRAHLGRGPEAVELFERYLRIRPNAIDADAVRIRIEQLRATAARIRIETEPEGARVTLDGVETSYTTPIEFEVAPGVHQVVLQLSGYQTLTGEVEVDFATHITLHEQLEVVSVVEPQQPEVVLENTEEEDETSTSHLSPVLITTSTIAGAALITGTILGFCSLSLESDYRQNPTEETANRGERFSRFADLHFGLALASTATSLVLHFKGRNDRRHQQPTRANMSITPWASSSGAGVIGGVDFK